MGELRHISKPLQHIAQIGVRQHRLAQFQQVAQVVHGRRYAVYEVLLVLKIASEAIGAEHLKRTEQHEERQTVGKMAQRRHLDVSFQRVIVFGYQLTPQLEWVLSRCLPQKGGQIIIERPLAPALKIDEERRPFRVEHYVAGLKVAVKEALARLRSQVLCQAPEAGLKL